MVAAARNSSTIRRAAASSISARTRPAVTCCRARRWICWQFTSVTSTDQVRARGTAADFSGIDRVLCAIQDRATGKWLRRDRTWGAYDRLKANVQDPGATSTNWLCARTLPPGSFTIKAIAFDSLNHVNPRPRPFRIVNVG